MFQGHSCYPLEMHENDPENSDGINEDDMLVKIFERSSQINPIKDFSFIANKQILDLSD